MAEKICTNCGSQKTLCSFSKMKRSPDGLAWQCKECAEIKATTYKRTKRGLITDLYRGQRYSSRKRDNDAPDYSLDDLRKWCFAQPNFNVLYDNWVKSGYKKSLRPSCDRLDDHAPYSFENIQLVTWGYNKLKGHSDRRNGINNKTLSAVFQISNGGKIINVYPSLAYASRKTSIDKTSISHCCNGDRKTAGGFKWAKVQNY